MLNPYPARLTLRMSIEDKALIDRAVRVSGSTQQDWATKVLRETAEGRLVDPAARSPMLGKMQRDIFLTRVFLHHVLATLGHQDLVDQCQADIEQMTAQIFASQA